MRALLDLIAPIRCLHCGATSDAELCGSCAERVHVLEPPLCERCGAPVERDVRACPGCRDLTGFRRARSLAVYAEPVRVVTLALKRRGRRGLASSIGELLAGLAQQAELRPDVVTFVPAGAKARRGGFDHAELIARATARFLGLPARSLLTRRHDGPRQADVPFARRRINVRDRFAADVATGNVLLVDDVFTTGATAEACSRALVASGAVGVDVLTWARTLRRVRRGC